VAVSPDLSLLAARAAHPILIVGKPAEFISGLPLHDLEPSPEMAAILDRWGIATAGQLLALDKSKIADRLGAEALRLFERLSPGLIRPLKLVAPPEQFTEQIEFEQEIETIQPLLFVLRRFVEQISRRLEMAYLVVGEFQLRLGFFSGANYERIFKIPSPTGNVEILFRTLRTHLETVRTDSPIVSMRLSATPSKVESHQLGLFEASLRNPNQFAETLARLGALCGSDNVGTPVLQATHRPDSFAMKTPDFAAKAEGSSQNSSGMALRRYRPALSARVEFCQQQPARLECPVFKGSIAKACGPFVCSGDWWDDHRWSRQEWDIETGEGALFRIFRSEAGFFVEGVYD
jgi:protein ImuB